MFFKSSGYRINRIKWLKWFFNRKAVKAVSNLIAALVIAGFSQAAAFAQTIDTSKIKAASDSIISGVQAISGIGVTLLLIVGFALLMWGVALRHAL